MVGAEANTLSSKLINPADRKIEWKVGVTGTGGGALQGFDTDTSNVKYQFINIDGISKIATIISAPTEMSILQVSHGGTKLEMRGSNIIAIVNSVGGECGEHRKVWHGNNSLGVDATGVYKSIAGVKTYL